MRPETGALLIASLLGAGCAADEGNTNGLTPGETGVDANPSGQNSGNTVPVGSTGSPNGTSVSSSSSGLNTGTNPPPPPPPPPACVPGIPETSQVPRMTPVHYNGALRDLLGVTEVDGTTPALALGIEENRGAMTATEWTAYQNVADKIAKAVVSGPNRAQFITCDPAEAACLESTIREFGLRAFRRPLLEEEVAQFMGFATLTPPPESPDEVAEAILYGFLTSPSFIMLPELDPAKEGEVYKLNQYEIATRLATLIWRSIPDDALLDAAKNNGLGTPAQVLEQANRMIAVKEKSGPLLADFHRFFAEINSSSHWNRTTHDPSMFPAGVAEADFNQAMMAEVDLFFAEVANSGRFQDLFLSPVAYVNQSNAAIYDLDPSQYTDVLTRVELEPAQRPGFLTRAAFLSSYSGFTKTSPILRGAFIGQKFLGATPVPPVAGVPTEPPPGEYKTRREEVDKLTEPTECAACHHTAINPPGYVMEMYDAMGAIQTVDPLGGPIDMVAEVMVDNVATTINNPLELMQAIANGASGQRRYAERWVEYATGRSPNANDACSVEPIALKLSTDGSYTIIKLLADLTQTDTFVLRTTGN